jgi:hypothetical protein
VYGANHGFSAQYGGDQMANSVAADISAQLDRYISSVEAAEYLGVDVRLLENWRSQGRGPRYRKFSKLVRYSIADLKAFANAGIVDPVREVYE